MYALCDYFIPQSILVSKDKSVARVMVFTALFCLFRMAISALEVFSYSNLILVVGCLLALISIRFSKLEWAKLLIIISGWVTLTWNVYTIEGLASFNMTGYIIILLAAVYFLPKNYWVGIFSITCLAIFLLAAGQATGIITPMESVMPLHIILFNRLMYISLCFGVFINTNNAWRKRERELRESQTQILKETARLASINQTLKINETRFRELVENAPEAIILYDVQKEKIVEANSNVSKLIGLSKDELLKAVPWDLLLEITPKFNEQQRTKLSQILMGESVEFKTTISHVNGHRIPISVQAIRLPDIENTLLRFSIIDLTDVIEKETQIQYQETLLYQISEAIISIDLNHRITHWNPAAEKIYGWKSSEVIGKFITDVIPTNVVNHTPYALEKEDDYRVEARQYRKDGSIVHISSSISPHLSPDGTLIGTVVTSRDISKRYKVQQALAENTEWLNSLINNMPAFVDYIDKDGKVVFLNDFHKQIGLNVDELIGSTYIELFQPEEQIIIKPEIDKALAGERAEFEMFFEALGIKYFMEVVFVPHKVNDDMQGFFVMGIDRTERLKALEALLDSQKIDSLGVLAGGIAHDFNNLLAAIMMQGSLVQLQLPEASPVQNNLSKLMDTTERAAMLAKQMLAYSGNGQIEINKINLNRIIEDSLRLFRTSIEPQIVLKLDYHESLPLIEADITQIQQVILNLLLNASDALVGCNKGEIELKTDILTIEQDDAKFWQYTGEPAIAGDYVCVTVIDTGEGMDSETIGKIFDPFFTTKQSGTGLGLAAVLGIVRGHGGGIEVKSAVNQGTTFTLCFPALKPPEEELVSSNFNYEPLRQ